jgi:hypothetical protein
VKGDEKRLIRPARVQVMAVSTAFEDWDVNTLDNTLSMVVGQKVHGAAATQMAMDDVMRQIEAGADPNKFLGVSIDLDTVRLPAPMAPYPVGWDRPLPSRVGSTFARFDHTHHLSPPSRHSSLC